MEARCSTCNHRSRGLRVSGARMRDDRTYISHVRLQRQETRRTSTSCEHASMQTRGGGEAGANQLGIAPSEEGYQRARLVSYARASASSGHVAPEVCAVGCSVTASHHHHARCKHKSHSLKHNEIIQLHLPPLQLPPSTSAPSPKPPGPYPLTPSAKRRGNGRERERERETLEAKDTHTYMYMRPWK